jgi:alpha-glucosidase
MAWDYGVNGGFSDGTPWLPVAAEHIERAVAGQEAQGDSTLAFFRHLIEWRRAHPVLRHGDLKLCEAHEQVLAFEREHDGRRLLCAFNLSDRLASYQLNQPGELYEVGGHGFASRVIGGCLELAPLQAFFAYVGKAGEQT